MDRIVSEFLADTPPGEVKNVIKDLNLIALGSRDTIKLAYDSQLDQDGFFEVVEVEGQPKLSVVSKYNKAGLKYTDPQLGVKFNVQALSSRALDVEDTEAHHDAYASGLRSYVKEHFPIETQGKIAYNVFEVGANEWLSVVVNTKYTPGNFINGKWLSYYKHNRDTGKYTGKIVVDIHYFEDGNVRLKTSQEVSGDSLLENLVLQIKTHEEKFEKLLNKKFMKLNDVNFKSLRRQLPVTRAKINWGKAIGNYRIGKDASETGI